MDSPLFSPSRTPASIIETLRAWHERTPDRIALTVLREGEEVESRVSFSQLHDASMRMACALRQSLPTGARVVLLLPTGLEFACAFYGCLAAGMVAIPALHPQQPRKIGQWRKLAAIVGSSGATLIIAPAKSAALLEGMQASDGLFALCQIATSEQLLQAAGDRAQANWPLPQANDLAFLQYTSGSTGSPKGVMITHANVIDNQQVIARAMGHHSGSHLMSWLPLYHDMGLSALLQLATTGGTLVLMPPAAFIQKPMRWLQVISDFRINTCGAPDFAYQLAATALRSPQAVEAGLDLSCWELAFCGAEPIRRSTVDAFLAAGAPFGLSPNAFFPCYGLAEATLQVTGGHKGEGARHLSVSGSALTRGVLIAAQPGDDDLKELVCCGRAPDGHAVRIVDESSARLPERQVGEIWVKSPSVGAGYYNDPLATHAAFCAQLTGEAGAKYLRTGDLGALVDGELYVTGRVKDMLVIRGRNLYPQDVEDCVQDAVPELRRGAGAAFATLVDDSEKLVIVQEIGRAQRRNMNADAVLQRMVGAVSDDFGLAPYQVVLVEPATIEMTSSGKISRALTRRAYMEGTLRTVAVWTENGEPADARHAVRTAAEASSYSSADADTVNFQSHFEQQIAEAAAVMLKTEPALVSRRTPWSELGFDSIRAPQLASLIERSTGLRVETTTFWECANVEELARHLAAMTVAATDSGGLQQVAVPSLPIRAATPRDAVADAHLDVSRHAPTDAAGGHDIKALQDELQRLRDAASEAIAIVGIGCRLPGGADSADSLWELLAAGTDAVTLVPPDRWSDALYDPRPGRADTSYSRHGAFIDGVDQFDPAFFGVSGREARHMDPQQRLLLECSWRAIEEAGFSRESIRASNTGVFVGSSLDDYARISEQVPAEERSHAKTSLGTGRPLAAGRIAYLFGLHGPTVQIDTACSSSLATTHLACQSLRNRECDMALSGGVNLMLSPEMTIALCELQALSPDGRCRTFDAGANGYVRGEGAGVVALMRLSDAVAQGRPIRALIRGSALNHDGKSNGMTAPNGRAQREVIRAALQRAGVAPSEVDYVEAHGTGTALGDPIELRALHDVYCRDTGRTGPLHVGSIKTNIGHLEAAASVASLVKVVCCLQKAELPAHLHFETPTPHVDWGNNGIRVTDRHMPWPASSTGRRVAAISSFGMSGTNAHLIVEAWRGGNPVEQHPAANDAGPQIVPLSGHSPGVLRRSLRDLDKQLLSEPQTTLGDLAHSLRTARDTHTHRRAFVVRDVAALCVELARSGAAPLPTDVLSPSAPRLAFLFSGQGAQYLGMGHGLYQRVATFRQHIDACDAHFKALAEHSLIDVLWGGNQALVNNTQYTQPALFALEVSLARTWIDWGIAPAALMGHSVGEYAAACVAGVFSMEDGLRLVTARGRLMQLRTPLGAMAAVLASAADIAPRLQAWQGRIALAADNGPQSVVVAGDPEAMAMWSEQLAQEGVQTRPLPVARAFHSALMESMLEPFRHVAATVRFQAPRMPLVSNLTGRYETERFCEPGYWVDHVRQAVQFRQGMQCLLDNDIGGFLEIGPGKTLATLARACAPTSLRATPGRFLHSIDEQHDDHAQLLLALSALYGNGQNVQWPSYERSVMAADPPRRTHLPPYPFERASYWVGTRSPAQGATPLRRAQPPEAPADRRPMGRELHMPGTGERRFEQSLSLRLQPILRGHVVRGRAIFPAAGYMAMAFDAARRGVLAHPLALHDFAFKRPLRIDEDNATPVSTWLHANADGTGRFDVYSRHGGGDGIWTLHASAQAGPSTQAASAVPSLQQLHADCSEPVDADALYAQLKQAGLAYGETFRVLGDVTRHGDWALGRVRRTAQSASAGQFADVAMLDACFHLVAAALQQQSRQMAPLYLPVGLQGLRGEALGDQSALWCAVHIVASTPLIRADLWIYDEGGRCLLALQDLQLTAIERRRVGRPASEPHVHRMAWRVLNATNEPPFDAALCLLASGDALTGAMHAAAERLGRTLTLLPPVERADELTLSLERLARTCDKPIVLLHDWDIAPNGLNDGAAQLRAIDAQFQRVVHCWRALQGIDWGTRQPRLALLTHGAHSVVDGDPMPLPSQAAAWGLARSLMHEASAVEVSIIDLGQADAAHCMRALRAMGSAEHERQCAVRDDTTFVPRIQPHALTAATSSRLTHGTWLVTGGRGALGTALIEWLIAKGARSIVSASRQLPDEGDAARLIAQAEAAGVTLVFRAVDVADMAAVQALVDDLAQDADNPLKGVFHAAGVLDDGLLQTQDNAAVLDVLRPKVAGGTNLHLATAGLTLDHFVMFSSVVSCIGSPGQCAYGAANAYLDALAASRRASGLTAQSISWGLWGGQGMASQRDAAHQRRADAAGLFAMAPAQALDTLDRLLMQGSGHELVWSVDADLLSRSSPGLRALLQEVARAPSTPRAAEAAVAGAWSASLRGLAPGPMRQALTQRLVNELAATLQMPAASLNPRTALIELGMDSLVAAEFRNAIRKELQVDIPFGRLLDGATLDDIVATLVDTLGRNAQAGDAPPTASGGTQIQMDFEQGQI